MKYNHIMNFMCSQILVRTIITYKKCVRKTCTRALCFFLAKYVRNKYIITNNLIIFENILDSVMSLCHKNTKMSPTAWKPIRFLKNICETINCVCSLWSNNLCSFRGDESKYLYNFLPEPYERKYSFSYAIPNSSFISNLVNAVELVRRMTDVSLFLSLPDIHHSNSSQFLMKPEKDRTECCNSAT